MKHTALMRRLSYGGKMVDLDITGLVTMPEARRMTGLDRLTLRQWALTGRVRGVNMAGRLWVFNRDDLERAMAARRDKIRA